MCLWEFICNNNSIQFICIAHFHKLEICLSALQSVHIDIPAPKPHIGSGKTPKQPFTGKKGRNLQETGSFLGQNGSSVLPKNFFGGLRTHGLCHSVHSRTSVAYWSDKKTRLSTRLLLIKTERGFGCSLLETYYWEHIQWHDFFHRGLFFCFRRSGFVIGVRENGLGERLHFLYAGKTLGEQQRRIPLQDGQVQ